MPRATSSFVIDRWDEAVVVDHPGAKFVRTSIGKTFSGDLTGTSVGEMTMAHASESSRAYSGYERIVGTVGGRAGTFVLVHQAIGSAAGGSASWTVMADSGTGELAGITGTAQIARHPDGSHTFDLDYEVPSIDRDLRDRIQNG